MVTHHLIVFNFQTILTDAFKTVNSFPGISTNPHVYIFQRDNLTHCVFPDFA